MCHCIFRCAGTFSGVGSLSGKAICMALHCIGDLLADFVVVVLVRLRMLSFLYSRPD